MSQPPICSTPARLVTTPGRDRHRLFNGYRAPRWRGVLPVRNRIGAVGTASVVGPGLALTALHVVNTQPVRALWVGDAEVRSVATLPLADYVGAYATAFRSRLRAEQLAGPDPNLHTVDLALLTVPGPRGPAMRVRDTPLLVGTLDHNGGTVCVGPRLVGTFPRALAGDAR